MTLSKLLSEEKPQINYKLALLVGTPVVVLLAGAAYYKYCSGGGSGNKTEASKKDNNGISSSSDKKILPTTSVSLKEDGNKLFKQGKYEEALELYTKAIECCEDGDQLGLLFQNRAAVFEKLGNYNSVIRETSSALSLNPKYVKALHRRSKAYKQTGFLDEALEDITAVCILEQFASPSSVQLADDILKEIGSKEGDRLLRERDDQGVKPGRHTVTAYLRGFYNCPLAAIIGDYNDDNSGAGDSLFEGVTGPYLTALLAFKNSEYDDIISHCSEELKRIDSGYKNEARYLRGTFRFLYGYKAELIIEDFEYVIENSANKSYKSSAYIKLASHYALVDKEVECEECFSKSFDVWPDNVDWFHHKGQVLLTRGNLPAALELMTKAAEMESGWAIAVATKWYVQYRILGSGGDNSGADSCVKEFSKLIKKFPTSPDVFSLYGQILMENGLFTEADTHFERVLELDKTNASVIVHRAMSKFQNGGNNAEVAIDMLKEAIKIDERNEFVYETLGTLHLQIGELDSAILYITKALALARSHQELTILSSLKKAAEVQKKVKEKLNLVVTPGLFR